MSSDKKNRVLEKKTTFNRLLNYFFSETIGCIIYTVIYKFKGLNIEYYLYIMSFLSIYNGSTL